MGGRIGQRQIYSTGGGVGNVSVSGGGSHSSTTGVGEFAKNTAIEYGISGNINIDIVSSGENSSGGAVGFENSGGNIYKIKNQITIMVSPSFTKYQVQEVVKHELTHIKQSQDGRFYFNAKNGKDGGYYFDGKKIIGASGYSKILKDMRSQDKATRIKAYTKYRNLPWEVEAHNAGDPFKGTNN